VVYAHARSAPRGIDAMATLTSAKYSERLINGCPMEKPVHAQVGNVTEGLTFCVKELAANNVVSF
jgi:hypothetical protein